MTPGNPNFRYALLALALASAAALIPHPVLAQEISGTWETTHWRDDERGQRVQLNLTVRDADGRWNHGSSYDLAEFDGLTAAIAAGSADDVTFRLVREAGTITFEGDFRGGEGTGRFRFAPDSRYVETMASLGYGDIEPDHLLLYATLDVTTDYVRGLAALGYTALGEKDLTRFAIHGVRLEYIRAMNDLGYTDIAAGDLVRMRIHGVTEDYVRRVMAALR